MEYVTRYKITKEEGVKEVKIPKPEAVKLIMKLLKNDRDMLNLLAKL